MRKPVAAIIALSCVAGAHQAYGHPNFSSDNNGFGEGSNHLQTKDQLAMESYKNETSSPSASDKAGRFGFPTYATDGQNINNVVPGLYGPVKLDIGGLVLGTIVGLGAFFILPKIFHVISAPYGGGGYKRSEEEPSVGGASINEIYALVSKGIESMNVDQGACLQRAICFSVQTSPASQQLIDALSRNDFVKSMLAGSEWELAVNAGRSSESCGLAFPKCPFSVDSIIKPLIKYMNTLL